MNDQTQLESIGQISVNAHDIDRATAFYREQLGLCHLFSVPGMAFFDCGGIRLMVTLASEPRFNHPSSILYFKVADIKATHQALLSKGVVFEREPFLVAPMPSHDLWMAFFQDSENNILALMSEVQR